MGEQHLLDCFHVSFVVDAWEMCCVVNTALILVSFLFKRGSICFRNLIQ